MSARLDYHRALDLLELINCRLSHASALFSAVRNETAADSHAHNLADLGLEAMDHAQTEIEQPLAELRRLYAEQGGQS